MEITGQFCAIDAIDDIKWDPKTLNQIQPASNASLQRLIVGGKGQPVPWKNLFRDAGFFGG